MLKAMLSPSMRAGLLGLFLASCAPLEALPSGAPPQAPNVVLLFTDDQGYGDLSCFGHPTIHTPNVDRLAAEGAKLTQFYVASPVCTPSRAALLTGCYPKRVGMQKHVVFPRSDYGLHPNEVTLAEVLKTKGYATGMFGKWHLGHREGFLPNDQGFDRFFGVPYSNDMAQFHRKPDTKYELYLPLMRDGKVIEWEPDQRELTRRCTQEALQFIDEVHEQPFLLYVPYSMPHLPIYASAEFQGKSNRGTYGDVIEEIDWSVGEIMEKLDELELTDKTLVIFTSDNGPWLEYMHKGGSAGPLRGGKATNWEGGQRVPCVMRWPGVIPAGSLRRELLTTMDIFPTLSKWARVTEPPKTKLDGRDVGSLLRGLGAQGWNPANAPFLYYTAHGELAGIRRGPWKLLIEANEFYNVDVDISEQWDKAEDHEGLIEELHALALRLDHEIESNARPVGRSDVLRFDPAKPMNPDGSAFQMADEARIPE